MMIREDIRPRLTIPPTIPFFYIVFIRTQFNHSTFLDVALFSLSIEKLRQNNTKVSSSTDLLKKILIRSVSHVCSAPSDTRRVLETTQCTSLQITMRLGQPVCQPNPSLTSHLPPGEDNEDLFEQESVYYYLLLFSHCLLPSTTTSSPPSPLPLILPVLLVALHVISCSPSSQSSMYPELFLGDKHGFVIFIETLVS